MWKPNHGMKFLRSTVAVRDDLTEENLRNILLAQTENDAMPDRWCIADLDNTDTEISPAKEIAKKRIGVETAADYLKLSAWGFWTGAGFLTAVLNSDLERAMEKVKEQQFADYDRTFLRKQANERGYRALKEEVESKIIKMIDNTYVVKSLFAGVKDFYQALRAKKMYLSRNLNPIVKAYADFLQFDEFKAEIKNKDLWMEHLITTNKQWKSLILRVDGCAEEDMIKMAKSYQKKKWTNLEEVLVIKRSVEMKEDFRYCDVIIGKDDHGLVEIMKSGEIYLR